MVMYVYIGTCVCSSGQARFRNSTFICAFCVQECCDAARQRVTNLVSKFPPVVWRPSETCEDKGRLLFTQSSSPFHLKWLVLFYVMFIVIVLTSLNPNSTWLFISARISLISRIILFMFALSLLFLPFVWRFSKISIESFHNLLLLYT